MIKIIILTKLILILRTVVVVVIIIIIIIIINKVVNITILILFKYYITCFCTFLVCLMYVNWTIFNELLLNCSTSNEIRK